MEAAVEETVGDCATGAGQRGAPLPSVPSMFDSLEVKVLYPT